MPMPMSFTHISPPSLLHLNPSPSPSPSPCFLYPFPRPSHPPNALVCMAALSRLCVGRRALTRIRWGGECRPVFMAIASPPVVASKGYLEFLVKDIEGATAGVLCDLYKGDRVELSQILGKGFNVDQVYPVEHFPTVLLFATGTGISPIRSLIELGIDAKSRRDVRLYYGARNLQRMAYQDKFKEWEASGIRVIPVLSQPNDKWNGEQGYVQVAFPKSKALTTPAHTGVFLCGHKAMAEASCDNNKRPNGMTLIPWKDMVWDITCVHPCTFSPCNVDCSGECSSRRCWKTRRLKSIRVWLARIIFALLVLKCWGLGDHPLAARFQKLDKG